MKILILEDDDNRIERFKYRLIGHSVDVTKLPDDAIRLIKEEEYDLIFLDHDLEAKHYLAYFKNESHNHDDTTGIKVAKFLGENLELCPNATVIVHSMNPAGGKRMADIMQKRSALHHPFNNLIDNIKLN